jgi:Zn-dependent protease
MFMTGERFYLGHMGPIPVYVAVEAIFLPVLVLLMFWGLPAPLIGIALVVLILTILVHELAHGAVATFCRMHGVSVIIGALGGLCTYAGDRRPGREFFISIAGPLANLAVALAVWLLTRNLEISSRPVEFLCQTAIWFNLFLGIFNLLPIYPFDGGIAALSVGRMLYPRAAKPVTLYLSVVTAIAAGGFAYYLGGGQIPIFMYIIFLFALMAAFRDLR